jgi:hypothetical protein
MIRLTATRPTEFDCAQLRAEAEAIAPGCLDVNLVEPDLIAGYWNDGESPLQSTWEALVAAHVPTPPIVPSSSDPLVVLVQALADASSFSDIQTAAANAAAVLP